MGKYNSNHSESWIAVQPGTENLVGVSKIFFEKFSTFYNFHLGAVSIPGGTPAGTVQIPGYDCVSTGTQAMPPSWTNDTDPNVAFDTKGRAYPVQHVDGLGQQACSAHRDPCTEVFLGDYFGLAVSSANVYGFFVSTHYPSNVRADEGGPVYYQQQVLSTVARSAFGAY